jgi:minor histocompatibility antigen H13
MDQMMLLAYLALGLMAVVPIHLGARASLKSLPKPPSLLKPSDPDYESDEENQDQSEALSMEDAYMFPVIGSGVLFSLYMVFRFLNKEWVNYLLTAYFAIIGVMALAKASEAVIRFVTGWKERGYHLRLVKMNKELMDVRFTHLHMATLFLSIVATAYYVYSKNWILSNLFGLAFATSAVQLIALDAFATGMILLGGLFFYDIFWVFGTEVMVSVAKNFDAPIKVVFPRDLWAEKLQFTMLGLGDIVIPGIFVALCLRFDQFNRMKQGVATMKSKFDFSKPYYTACFVAYCVGLVTTVVVMHTFQAAQPALLYLSPACTLSVLLMGAVRGELSQVFAYKDGEEETKKEQVEDKVEEEGETPSSASIKKRRGRTSKT